MKLYEFNFSFGETLPFLTMCSFFFIIQTKKKATRLYKKSFRKTERK